MNHSHAPPMNFTLRCVRFHPGINSRAELVTLVPGLRLERRFAPLARGLNMLYSPQAGYLDGLHSTEGTQRLEDPVSKRTLNSCGGVPMKIEP